MNQNRPDSFQADTYGTCSWEDGLGNPHSKSMSAARCSNYPGSSFTPDENAPLAAMPSTNPADYAPDTVGTCVTQGPGGVEEWTPGVTAAWSSNKPGARFYAKA